MLPGKMGLSPEYSLSHRTTYIFKPDLHFGSNYTSANFHVCISKNGYNANEILLTQQNKQTYKQLPKYSQPVTRWSTLQDDMSPGPLFGSLIQTHTQTDRQTC